MLTIRVAAKLRQFFSYHINTELPATHQNAQVWQTILCLCGRSPSFWLLFWLLVGNNFSFKRPFYVTILHHARYGTGSFERGITATKIGCLLLDSRGAKHSV